MNWTHQRLTVTLSAFTILLVATTAGAQMPGYGPAGGYPGAGLVPPQAVGPQMYVQWGDSPGGVVPAQAVEPAGLERSACGGGGGDGCGGSCGSGCDDCGGGGFLGGGLLGLSRRHFSLGGGCGCGVCNQCAGIGCGGLGHGLFGNHGPWPDGDGQFCQPRWWDVSVEAIWLKRENMPSNLVMTSYGSVGAGITEADVALETDDLGSFDYSPGFRLSATKIVGPGTNVEVGYFGATNWASTARVTAANFLYSVLSDFGEQFDPVGFVQTDIADLHRISYSSDLNSLEVNLRRRFVSPDCWLHTSALMGVRYVRIEEDFTHQTKVQRVDRTVQPPDLILAGMDYQVKTKNDLIGYQLGGDFWACILPAWKFGGDLKGGIYGNHARQKTYIDTGGIPLLEADGVTQVSFTGEANLWLVYHITSRMTLRGGYQFLYISSIALAPENFNTAAPAVLTPNVGALGPGSNQNRRVDIDGDGFAFYHGFNFGFEWTW